MRPVDVAGRLITVGILLASLGACEPPSNQPIGTVGTQQNRTSNQNAYQPSAPAPASPRQSPRYQPSPLEQAPAVVVTPLDRSNSEGHASEKLPPPQTETTQLLTRSPWRTGDQLVSWALASSTTPAPKSWDIAATTNLQRLATRFRTDTKLRGSLKVQEQVVHSHADNRDMGLLQVTYPGQVFFDFDRASLRSDSYQTLTQFAEILQLQEAADAVVTVVGHTDAVGSDSYNIDLGRRRAGTVAAELVKRGLPKSRIIIVSAGERQPIASNKTENGRARNRRVEFLVSDFPQAHVIFLKERPINAAFINDHMLQRLREAVPNQVEFMSIEAFKADRKGRTVEFVEPRLMVQWYYEDKIVNFYTPES